MCFYHDFYGFIIFTAYLGLPFYEEENVSYTVCCLKVKNDVTHWKTIIPGKSQILIFPNFLLLSS